MAKKDKPENLTPTMLEDLPSAEPHFTRPGSSDGAERESADLAGVEICQYRLLELLGEGGMGSVWLPILLVRFSSVSSVV